MKKYLSCIILILLCLICVMVFYVNAKDFSPNDGDNSTLSSGSTLDSSTTDSKPDVEKATSIEKSGSIVSEYLTDTNLRIEWALFKQEGDDSIYLSAEVYLDTPNQITNAGNGILSVNGKEQQFMTEPLIGTTNLIYTYTEALEYKENMEIKLSAFLEINSVTACGDKLSNISASGSVFASEQDNGLSKKASLLVEHISQYPELPSGDEITSLAIVLKYLKYNVDKNELCELYLEKGPVGHTDLTIANAGNPKDTHNSYGCLPPVIVRSASKYIDVFGGGYTPYDISGYDVSMLYKEIACGNPVIVWACEDFDITPSVSRTWIVNGEKIYLKSNTACMVLAGYDYEANTVTLVNPAGTTFDIDMELFELRFAQVGSYAIVIK